MNILIIYESKHGATKKCAEYLDHNNESTQLIHINDCSHIDLSQYDKILIGSPIYVGRINKKITQWIQSNLKPLLQKNTKIFLSGMNKDGLDDVLQSNFTDEMINNFKIEHVGGAYNFDDMNFFERFIVKKIAKITESKEDINYERLSQL